MTKFLSLVSVIAVTALLVVVVPAAAKAPLLYSNCKHLNAKYPHGVGKVGARDKTKSGTRVTSFKRSNKIFALAMSYNRGLDRDHDGIACEKK